MPTSGWTNADGNHNSGTADRRTPRGVFLHCRIEFPEIQGLALKASDDVFLRSPQRRRIRLILLEWKTRYFLHGP